MKILILGAQGNLGTQLVKAFADYDLLQWDREEADLLDLDGLISKITIANPDIIINAAAYNAVDKCEQEETEKDIAWKLNKNLPVALAKWCKDNNKILVHYSTDYVFSGTELQKEFIETDTPNPLNIYGETKAAGEKAIADSQADAYVIRVSKLFGPSGSSPYSKKSFFDIILGLAKDKPALTVVDEEVSCFTYTPDLATATREMIEDKYPYGIYHLINEGAATWYEACLELKNLSGFQAAVEPISSASFSRPANRPAFSVLKNNKFANLRPYQEALAEYLKNNK